MCTEYCVIFVSRAQEGTEPVVKPERAPKVADDKYYQVEGFKPTAGDMDEEDAAPSQMTFNFFPEDTAAGADGSSESDNAMSSDNTDDKETRNDSTNLGWSTCHVCYIKHIHFHLSLGIMILS